MTTPIDPQRFAERLGSWLYEEGPDADVVVTSRVRLARNLRGYLFIPKLEPQRAVEMAEELGPHLCALGVEQEFRWVEVQQASALMRLLLRERHLVSRELAPAGEERSTLPGRGVAFSADERTSVMVNEEDHLRIQSLAPGFDLEGALQRARRVDQQLESQVEYAFEPRLGYLTCCPTNVGTGLRASVMLHLPALGMVRTELDKVMTAAQRTGLAVRGLYGEGSRAVGDYYQVSNQVTLGRNEDELVEELSELVPAIVRFERSLRQQLMEEQKVAIQDRVSRSFGMLRTARAMPTDGALAHLSNLRLGSYLGLWSVVPIRTLNKLRVHIQRGHIQALNQKASSELLEASERDRLRAAYMRRTLAASA